MFLNGFLFVFVIDFVVLVLRREYFKLDKWLKDKFKEYKVMENFLL